MKDLIRKPLFIFLIVFILILCGVLIALVVATKPMPVALIQEYGIGRLWEEGKMMNECAECHKAVDFHDCATCHDDHGAVELAGLKFYEVVELTGDVPEHRFVRVNEVLPNQTSVGTHILLFDFLSQQGVDDFESVTFITNDGGLTTIEAQYLDETAMLVPYVDGVRFVTESVHVSTWLKGIKQIIVVGIEKPLTIDGEGTSIGRLLLGDTVRLTVEGSDTMLTDEDGRTGMAFVGNWVEGARLLPLLKTSTPATLIITDRSGSQVELAGEEIEHAILAVVRKEVTLVLPDRGRSAWPTDVIQIESK
ncbi:MAG: hypothetical protein K0B06_00440 [Brevefilum sp.]|nr:hypothetical protein [Brevefilum sp.]